MRLHEGVLLFLLTSSLACSERSSEPVEDQRLPRAIALVNGDPVFESDFEAFLASSDAVEPAARVALFREFLTQHVLLQAADDSGVEISESEVQPFVERWLGRDAVPDANLESHIRALLKTQKYVRQHIGEDTEVDLNEVLTYYQLHAEEFVVDDQVRVLEILLRPEDRVLAEQIRQPLKPGDLKSFRAAAELHSIGAAARNGGDLGLFQKEELPARFADFIFNLKVGEVSSVFRSELGYHIFMVEERIPKHARKFYEAQEEIFARLVGQKERLLFDEFVNKVLQNASIEVLDPELNKNWRKQNVELQ